MLTITNPEDLDFPGGLLPTHRVGDSRMILIVKAAGEIALTARLRRFFRFYLAPLHSGGVDTCGLLTAFFDDHDEPLAIGTPLFDGEITSDFLQLLSSESFDVYFLDEHNRELLGFRAENRNATRFRLIWRTIRFVPLTFDRVRQFHDHMHIWFGARSPSDDDAAFNINLREELFPPNPILWRQNPGALSEHDIATAMHRPFVRDHVHLNPIRAVNGREFVDVLVATEKTVLLIQAKDSPNTEAALSRSIDRKRATARAHIDKAIAQLRGSINFINHLRSDDSIEIIIDGERHELSRSDRKVFGLVIVKELFDLDRPVYSPIVFAVFEDTGIPCLLLDYQELQRLTLCQPTEEGFVDALGRVFSFAREAGVFPRNRFWPQELASPPYSTIEGGYLHDHVTGGDARRGFRDGLGPDWLGVVVDRIDVEALDVSRAEKTISGVLADKETIERFRGRVDLAFHGYSNDPRELYEMPEVRRFCAKLDDAFPFWFYFLSTERATLGVIACCLCSVAKVRPGGVSLGPDLLQFMTRHFGALNRLVDTWALDEKHNVEISGQVRDYFNKFGEPIR